MIEILRRFWLESLCTVVFGVLGFSVKLLWEKVKTEISEQKRIKEGVVAILHDRLFQVCTFFIEQGDIGVEELRNIEYLFRAYSDLGGNGTCAEIYARVKSLPLKNK